MGEGQLPTGGVPRFLPLFGIALGVRFGVVALGVLLVWYQPARPVRVFGLGVAGFPADLRPAQPGTERHRESMLAGSARLIEPWYRWDGAWMAELGTRGYAGSPDEEGRIGVAFLPAVPAVFAAADWLGLNPYWAALIVVNVAGAAGAAVFARVAARLTGSREVGIRTFALLLAFPTALFFSAPYNESFGLLFTALALAAWLDRKPVRAGLCAAGASLARMTGVATGVAALAHWLFDERTRPGLKRAVIVAVGSFAGLALFWCFLWYAVGDPLAGLKSQTAWGRRGLSPLNPWYAIRSIYDPSIPRPDVSPHFWTEAVVVLGFTVLGIRAWVRRGAFWGVLTLVPIGQMLMSGSLLSANRLVLASLPAFIELADLLKSRVWFRITVAGFAVAQLVLVNRFVHWQWAG
jgi:hypothetical protein